jgi:hypothetical protein
MRGESGAAAAAPMPRRRPSRGSTRRKPGAGGTSKQETHDAESGAGGARDEAENRKKGLARQKIQGTQHQAEFEQTLADVESQSATLLGDGFGVLGGGVLLLLFGVAAYLSRACSSLCTDASILAGSVDSACNTVMPTSLVLSRIFFAW